MYESITTTLEYAFHGLPRYVTGGGGALAVGEGGSAGEGALAAEMSSVSATTRQPWSTMPVSLHGSRRLCAVTVSCCPSSGTRDRSAQRWSTAAALPKTKSTVPRTSQSR
jgi:hypothetical protein